MCLEMAGNDSGSGGTYQAKEKPKF